MFFPSRGFLWGWALWGYSFLLGRGCTRGKVLVLLSAPLSPFERQPPLQWHHLGTPGPLNHSPLLVVYLPCLSRRVLSIRPPWWLPSLSSPWLFVV